MGFVGNPESLTRLVVAVLLIVGATFVWRQYLLRRKARIAPGRELTPTEVGCLYGPRCAAAVALLWLDESTDENGHRSADAVNGDAYTAHVAQRGRVLNSPTVAAVRDATGDRLDEMTGYLVDRGLLASRADRRLALAPLLATAVALVAVAVGILVDGGAAETAVPAILLCGVVLAGAVLRVRFGRTRAGDAYLTTIAARYPVEQLRTPRDWAYAVAVHGPAALDAWARDRGEWQRSAVDALSTDDYRRQAA
ncbi:TIGR04222 domain-containing membrane protein [Gordonia neofelifaecis]|uniref:TIGR04222 domain-containing membrane protein n=1 Tax=Gordonia neofelifaecis NRRL B-59395 TaxID=644548 RepID=F1YJ74_9ACTN|nr:TIGR04222 domain-containing membrane protein [Gordonia neofelifaecis]EGD55289.1 hypothetical protein SCNU_10464 [Gordonia neofelifaecis NRRL B-59395]